MCTHDVRPSRRAALASGLAIIGEGAGRQHRFTQRSDTHDA